MKLQKNNEKIAPERRRRRLLIPVALAFFVVVGMVCAVGALFMKHQLEHARAFSVNAVREYIGLEFSFETLSAEGLRMLHVTGLHLAAPIPGAGRVSLDLDDVWLRLSLSDLLRGQFALGEATVAGGRLVFEEARRDNRKRDPHVPGPRGGAAFLANLPSVRVKGRDCAVELHLASQQEPIIVRDIVFSLSAEPEADRVSGEVSGRVSLQETDAALAVSGHYRTDGLELNLDISGVTPELLRPFVAVPEEVDGELDLAVHVWGNPERQIMADAEIVAKKAAYVGLPVPVEDLEVAVRGLLQWDAVARKATLLDGHATSALAKIALTGHIDFAAQPPLLDASAVLTDAPVEELLEQFMPESVQDLGAFEVSLPESVELRLGASGPLAGPGLSARLRVPALDVRFKPSNPQLPQADLNFSRGEFLWEDFKAMPSGSIHIAGGAVVSSALGLEADAFAGDIVVDASGVSLRPLTARISGKPFSGTARYVFPEGPLQFSMNGTLSDIEKTPLHNMVKKLWLGGDIGFIIDGEYMPGGRLWFKASADVTRGSVAYEWWLNKPVAVGATIEEIEVTIIPEKSLEVKGEAYIEDTHILAHFQLHPHEGTWKNRHIRVDLPYLEVNSAGKCIQIPYVATGGSAREGFYEWRHAGTSNVEDNISTIGGVFDHVSFLPEGGEYPLVCKDARVQVTLTNIEGVDRSAELVVHAAEADVPPFGETWLLPIGSTDPEYRALYPEEPRPWTYKLSADKIAVPPWEGRNLEAEVYSNEEETGFHYYRAEVGDGRLEGTYRHEKDDNVMHLRADWEGIPAKYIIRHLELPEILEGTITGNVVYTVDQDDPRTTMESEGQFRIEDGHFLGDAIRSVFQHSFSDSFAALHPAALQFKEVSSDLRIVGDHIHTENVVIRSPGMTIKGDGVWIMEGDLDYRIDIAVNPDLADQLPVLRESFNVQGFRMTQRDIELGFHLSGPTFSPTGQLAGLPTMAVTIVSGAAEMTSEAMRLLDTPRQMLLSIFRVGGGLLGATRTQQQQQQQP